MGLFDNLFKSSDNSGNNNNDPFQNGGGNTESAQQLYKQAREYMTGSDDRKAFSYMLKSAQMGYAPAQYELAKIYRTGQGVKQDFAAAKKWLAAAAAQNHCDAMQLLASMYENYCGGEATNFEEARRFYVMARQAGMPIESFTKSIDNLNKLETSSLTGGKAQTAAEALSLSSQAAGMCSPHLAMYYRLQAAELGDIESRRVIGLAYFEADGMNQNPCDAMYWLMKNSYENNNMFSTYILGKMIEYGSGVTPNKTLALQFYTKAGKLGHRWAQTNAEYIKQDFARTPENIPYSNLTPEACRDKGYELSNQQNYSAAFPYFYSGAVRGNALCQNEVGLMYLLGRNGCQSYNDAALWLLMAAMNNIGGSFINLGYMFENGFGFFRSYKRAAYFYNEAKKRGQTDALNFLLRVKPNVDPSDWNMIVNADAPINPAPAKKARNAMSDEELYEDQLRGAQNGNTDDMLSFALNVLSDDVVPQNIAEAENWLIRAKNGGNMSACAELGLRYSYNIFGGVRSAEAEQLLQQAADAGSLNGKKYLEDFCFNRNFTGEINYPQTAEECRRIYSDERGKNHFGFAHKFMVRAAMYGDADAQRVAGLAALRGEYTEISHTAAVYWLFKSFAEGNNKFAPFILARMIEHGTGFVRRRSLALEYYRLAADLGHQTAPKKVDYLQADLNNNPEPFPYSNTPVEQCYDIAVGTDDIRAKFDYFLSGALRGHSACQNEIGVMYVMGNGVERNFAEGMFWLLLAKRAGNYSAAYSIGIMFMEGMGMAPDYDIAEMNFRDSLSMGNSNAASALEELAARRRAARGVPQPAGASKQPAAPKPPVPEAPRKPLNLDELPDNLDGYFTDVIGMASVKEELEKIYQFVKVQLRRERVLRERGAEVPQNKKGYNFVLLGNPGTGKTTVARIIARILYDVHLRNSGEIVEVDRSNIVGSVIGETEEKMRGILDSAHGGTLFIDEAYSLYREDSGNDFGREAIDVLMKDMEDNRDNYSVIIAGYKKQMMNMINNANPGFKSRFNYYIEIPDYIDDELIEIAHSIIEKQQYIVGEGVDKAIRKWINHERIDERFGNARAMRELVEQAIENQAMRISTIHDISDDDLFVLAAEDFWSGTDDEDDVKHYLDELNGMTGLASVKAEVKTLIDRIQVNALRESRGLAVSSGYGTLHMAFKGSAGTGKTTVARIIAKLYNAMGILKRSDVFVEVTRADLVGQHVGETAIKTKKVVESALGGILFIDEAYSLVQDERDTFGREAVDTLVAEMENRRDSLIVIFAGYGDDIDRFFGNNQGLRSRVPIELYFEDYTPDEMFTIMNYMLAKHKLRLSEAAEIAARQVIAVRSAEDCFGNARGIRNLVDGFIRKQNVRLANMAPNELTDEHLLLIEPEDIL